MKIGNILGNINAGVNSNIVGKNSQSISAPSPIIEKYNLALWLVFILGFLAGIFVYWIFSTIKSIKSHKEEKESPNESELNQPDPNDQESE